MLADIELLIGRIFTSIIFLSAGWEKIQSPAGTGEYMAKAGGIAAPLLMPLLYLSMAVELVGALMLIFGVRAKLAALIVFLWMVPVTFLIHFRNGRML
jgi:putative oxidoreductase